ncbi:MAG: beta-galactosidase, partial [Armatimonadota bacterium]
MRTASRIGPLLLMCCVDFGRADDLEVRRPVLDVNAVAFPASSLADFSFLLDPPAGKRGFLRVCPDGRFTFEDGTPARFWGVNVAKDAVFQPIAVVDAAIDAIAAAGFNLVRLHHLDDVSGLLPAEPRPDGRRIAPDALTKVDYWIAGLKQRGIYVYLDLLDYRTFHQWERVRDGPLLGRGAKPYAVFDETLISLQKRYAKALLVDHVNPYTGLSYADDPTVCMVELCDENGLFKRLADLPSLREPYRTRLRRRWNEWLARRYETTEALRAAWADARHGSDLRRFESLEERNVLLPRFERGTSAVGPRRPGPGASRRDDFVRFAADVHRGYFAQMRSFLRELGLRVPVTAVTNPKDPADLQAVGDALDFVATNFYWDHPYFRRSGEWRLPAYYHNGNPADPAGEEGFSPTVAACKLPGKPLVVREWAYCWPNKYRATGMVEAAACGLADDVAALILFAYDTRPGRRSLGYFDVRRDPARWGLAALAGYLFLGRHVSLDTSARGDVVRRDEPAGVVFVDAPTFRAVCGRLNGLSKPPKSSLMLTTTTPIGAVVAASLDGLPLEQSRY